MESIQVTLRKIAEPPLATVIRQAFSERPPYSARAETTTTWQRLQSVASAAAKSSAGYVPWERVNDEIAATFFVVELATARNISGYSPRWYGETTYYVVSNASQFRILCCQHAGGREATWGFRSPLCYGEPSTEDKWSVVEAIPMLLPMQGAPWQWAIEEDCTDG